MRDFAHQIVYSAIFWVLNPAQSQDAHTEFEAKYVKRHVSVHGCAFSGSQNQNLTFTPPFRKKTANYRPDFVPRNVRPKNSFNIGRTKSKRPLNVIVAP